MLSVVVLAPTIWCDVLVVIDPVYRVDDPTFSGPVTILWKLFSGDANNVPAAMDTLDVGPFVADVTRIDPLTKLTVAMPLNIVLNVATRDENVQTADPVTEIGYIPSSTVIVAVYTVDGIKSVVSTYVIDGEKLIV